MPDNEEAAPAATNVSEGATCTPENIGRLNVNEVATTPYEWPENWKFGVGGCDRWFWQRGAHEVAELSLIHI